MAHGSVTQDDRANTLANVTKTIGNLLDGYDIRLRPNFGGRLFSSFFFSFVQEEKSQTEKKI